ncbi:MAG: restriction endonuclease subunit S [Actinobacteria bacterium]|nr:restriction endonuclease subunit S [Actinomycetota bacterium]
MGDVPSAWTWWRIKNVAAINRESLPETTDPDRTIDYIDISTVSSTGSFSARDEMPFSAAPSRARRLVRVGDSIVSTVRTYLKAIAYIDAPVAHCVVSTGFATLTPRVEQVQPRYLYWWLRSSPFVEEVVARSVGVSYPAVNAADLGSIGIPTPPDYAEQEMRAQFLDDETAHLDAISLEHEQMLGPRGSGGFGLLDERRQALITTVMTGAPLEGLLNA